MIKYLAILNLALSALGALLCAADHNWAAMLWAVAASAHCVTALACRYRENA